MDFLRDLRWSVRTLARSPSLTIAVAVTLALGLSSATAIFSIANALLIKPFPFPRAGGLVSITEINPTKEQLDAWVSPADFAALRSFPDLFEDLCASTPAVARLMVDGNAEEILGKRISPEFFQITGVRPALGRPLVAADSAPDAPRVVLISFQLWAHHFGRSSDVLGNSLSVNKEAYRIVGVMPEDLEEFDRAKFWTPLGLASYSTNRIRLFAVLGRLRPGVSLTRADVELQTLGKNLAREFPATNAGYSFRLLPLRRHLVAGFGEPLTALLGAVAAFLLIGCVNVSNLLLARAAHREKETAVRLALGASWRQIVREGFTESVVLSFSAAILSAPLAAWLVSLLRSIAPPLIWRLDQVSVDWRVLIFAAVLASGIAVLFGLAPAWWATRVSPLESLQGGRSSRSPFSARGIGGVLVIVEITLALPLLVGSGLMLESLWRIRHADLGLKRERVFTMEVLRFRSRSENREFFRRLLEETRRLPGIEGAGLILFDPIAKFPGGHRNFRIEGAPAQSSGEELEASFRSIDPEYPQTIRIPLIEGRALAESDGPDSPSVALVDRSFVRRYFPLGGSLGRQLQISFPDRVETARIVGVVGDVASWPEIRVQPTIYMSYLQDPVPLMTLVIRSQLPTAAVGSMLRKEVARINPDYPAGEVRSLDESLESALAVERFVAIVLNGFSLLGLLLASVGTFSVISYLVERRRREIGIRVALGAEITHIVGLFVGRAARWAGLGIVLGIGAASALTRLLGSLLYGVTPAEARTLAAAAALLFAAAAVGAYVPARRAASLDPVAALRSD